jgi:hypothetical protein
MRHSICAVVALGFVAGCTDGSNGASAPATASSTVADSASTTLFGTQVVPAVTSTATAEGQISIGDTVAAHVILYGVSEPTAVHVHRGYAGVLGPVLVELAQDPVDPSRWSAEGVVPTEDTSFRLSRSQLYLDVHTAAHADGELRGQLVGYQNVYFVDLDPRDSVPPATGAGQGIAAVTESSTDDWTPLLRVHVHSPALLDASDASLRYGAVGQNGPIAHRLEPDTFEPTHWSIAGAEMSDADFTGVYVDVLDRVGASVLRGQLASRNWWRSEADDVLTVLEVSPFDGARVATLPPALEIRFSRDVRAASVGSHTVTLTASGGDGRFDDGDETTLEPLGFEVSGATVVVTLDGFPSIDDVYQLTLDGSSGDPVTDTDGAPLAGADPRSDFIATFAVDGSRGPPAALGEVQAVFDRSCAFSGCHARSAPAAGVDLSSGQSFASLIDVASVQHEGEVLVAPYDTARSHLVHVLDEPPWLPHRAGAVVPAASALRAVREWIDAGALDVSDP